MKVFAKSDIGRAREMNQDFYYVSPERDGMRLCILADGMGGYKGGEVASSLATTSARQYIEEKFKGIEPTKMPRNIPTKIVMTLGWSNLFNSLPKMLATCSTSSFLPTVVTLSPICNSKLGSAKRSTPERLTRVMVM